MRGLEKNYNERGQTDIYIYIDIATTKPKRPKGRFGENISDIMTTIKQAENRLIYYDNKQSY